MDLKVLESQKWYNQTYSGTPGYVHIEEDGITGAGTFKALVRALQYELGLSADGVFGKGTLSRCPTINPNTTSKNLIKILQCGFYCKGYACGGIDGDYGLLTKSAALNFKSDAGFPLEDANMQPVFIRALLNTDAFKLVRSGKLHIREAQQYLNANYIKKTDLIGLIPCNGVADRNMTKALIIALQYEEAGKKTTGVDGIYGNNTLNKAPALSPGSSNKDFIKIAQMCLMIMYGNPGLTGEYDAKMEKTVRDFQNFYCLNQDSRVIAGSIERITWASLLSSKGESSRAATACDCSEQILSTAKAKKLKESYNIVGRYLTGTVAGKKPKNLTLEELQILKENGLRVFPIYQNGGAAASYFNYSQGRLDAEKAIKAAQSLHIPNDTIIYFAVDYDFTEALALERVIPHFKGINEVIDASPINYKIGVYGARNICSLVCERGLAISSFVSDMSTGYSGNMGFPLPENWAFDQIQEYSVIASDGTRFDVDKNVSSGRDNGFVLGELCGGENFKDCTKHSMVLQEDGYYECITCGYRVRSPYLQDEEILSDDDYLRIRAAYALYSVSLGDDRYRNLAYTICKKMKEIRSKDSYKGKYEYQDSNGDCLLIPPEGDYNPNEFYNTYIREPETITSLNIKKYNGIYQLLADTLYGIAVDHKYALSVSSTIQDLMENGNVTITMNEILKALAEKAGQKEFSIILSLIQIGAQGNELEANALAEVGDIGVIFTYDMGSPAFLGDAVVIFDSNKNLKGVAF